MSVDEAPIRSALMSADQNIRAAHSTIINEAIRDLTSEMETWTAQRKSAIKSELLEAILTDNATTLNLSDDPHINAWILDRRAELRRAAKANINKGVFDETYQPWAIECVNGWRVELERRVSDEAKTFYTNLLSSEKTKLQVLVDQELVIFRNQLKVETEERKENARAASEAAVVAASKSSIKASKGCHRTNPVSGRRSLRSVSLSWPPPPLSPNSPASAVSLTPKALPAPLPPVPGLTDHALEPPPTNVSPNNSLEVAMLDVHTNQIPAPSYPVCTPHFVASSSPDVALPPEVPTSGIEKTVADQLAALSSQLTAQFSALSSRVSMIEANLNPTAAPTPKAPKAYSPSIPVANLNWGLPSHGDDLASMSDDDFFDEQSRLADEANKAAQVLDDFIEHLFRSINHLPSDVALSVQQQSLVYEEYTEAFRAFCAQMGLNDTIPFDHTLLPAFDTYLPTFWREKEQRVRAMATSITTHYHGRGSGPGAPSLGPLLPNRTPSLPPNAHPRPDSPAPASESSAKGWTQVGPRGRIVKASYATAVSAPKPATQSQGTPYPQSPASPGPSRSPDQSTQTVHTPSRIPTRAQLNKMSREDLLSLLRLWFNCTNRISPTLDKSFIVDSILACAAKETPPPPKTKPKARPLQMTEFTVIRPSVPGGPQECQQAVDLVVRSLRTRMQLQHGHNSPLPVSLLSGRWSSQSSPNFVLIFSGQPTTEAVMQFRQVFLDYFGERSTIIPQSGYAHMIINLVPISREADGSLPSPHTILSEMIANPAFHNMTILQDPVWINPNGISKKTGLPKTHASISFSFLDTDSTRVASFHKQQVYMFGGKVKVAKYVTKAILRQCHRCWRLNHSESTCPRPPTTLICPICGGRHLEDTHGANCSNHSSHSHAGRCDCAPSCFLCCSAKLPGKNHSARDTSCPLWKCF